MENSLRFLKKLKIKSPMWLIPLSICICSKELKTWPHKVSYVNIHSSIIYDHPQMEITQMSINCRIHKEHMVYPYSHIVKYYFAIERNEVLTHATIGINIKSIVLSVRNSHKRQLIVWFQLYEMSRIDKFVETQSTHTYPIPMYWISFWGDGSILELENSDGCTTLLIY